MLFRSNEKLPDAVNEGDEITIAVNESIQHNGNSYPITSLPQNLVDIIHAGGLVQAMRKLNGLGEG